MKSEYSTKNHNSKKQYLDLLDSKKSKFSIFKYTIIDPYHKHRFHFSALGENLSILVIEYTFQSFLPLHYWRKSSNKRLLHSASVSLLYSAWKSSCLGLFTCRNKLFSVDKRVQKVRGRNCMEYHVKKARNGCRNRLVLQMNQAGWSARDYFLIPW